MAGFVEIEFMDDEPAAASPPAEPDATTKPWLGVVPAVPPAIAAGALVVAAGLSLVAPFDRLSTVRNTFSDGSGVDSLTVVTDGWGRMHAHAPRNFGVDFGVTTRFGIMFAVCAGLLLLAAVLVLRRAQALALSAVAATMLLAGTTGAVALELLREHQNAAAANANAGPSGSEVETVTTGPGVWVGLGALICALAATALVLRYERVGRAPAPTAVPAVVETAPAATRSSPTARIDDAEDVAEHGQPGRGDRDRTG